MPKRAASQMTIREAEAIAGTLSAPSKMPWYGYSLPADRCRLGALLRKLPGTVCSSCYALKGRYVFPNTKAAMARRLEAIRHPLWVDAMVSLLLARLGRKPLQHFRWHDSGDLQDEAHLGRIAEICRRTPRIRHWLPTREVGIVARWLEAGGEIPQNLTVRLSAPEVGAMPANLAKLGFPTSGVELGEGHRCPASAQAGKCGPCRACWDPAVPVVDYPLH